MKQRRNLVVRLCIVVLTLLSVVGAVFIGAATRAEAIQSPVCYDHGDVNADGVIDSRDAVYTLYHYLFGDEEYPVQQDLDFNSDTSLDSRDAIYVLCAYNFQDDPNYQLDGIVHSYYDPTWQWEGNSAVATFKCGCGQVVVLGEADGVQVQEGNQTEATCVQAGSVEYVAQVVLGGKTYTNTSTTEIPARFSGHDMVDGSCTTASYCRNCDYTVAAPGHKWEEAADLSVDASCDSDAVQGFQCATCQETMTVAQEGTAGHALEYAADVARENCQYVKQYFCTACLTTFDGTAPSDTYYVHTYKATLTQEATCVSTGVKTYTCEDCGDSYQVSIERNTSHNWDAGVLSGNVTTYSCMDCYATKTSVAVAADEAVSKDSLGAAQELQLSNDTAVSLDEKVVENLDADREIKISVDTVDLSDVQIGNDLTQEQKEQIGDNPVYDFNMVYADNNDKVNFDGTVTVSLPYTLQPGEDVDSIDVWYIADDGSLERVDGTYSNGYVTFTTDHFSYYTVTRLTAAERCERYGHIPVSSSKAATCTEDGYAMSVCQRCGKELEKEVFKMTGHSFTVTENAATCDQAGSIVKDCGNCGHKILQILPAKGHNIALDTQASVAATCKAAGKNVYACTNDDCAYVREEALAQLAHDYFNYTYAPPTCDSKGVSAKTCRLCGEVFITGEETPLGHAFSVESAVWAWAQDNGSATVTLYCANDTTHIHTLNAVVTETRVEGDCVEPAGIVYTASASFNNVVYQDVIATEGTAPGHSAETVWTTDSKQHYHVCTVCGEKLDKANHNWNDGTVIQAATCGQPGKKLVKCTVCDLEQEKVIAATGKHTYVDGICSVCGHDESSCNHLILKMTELDLSAYNVCAGTDIQIYGCECKQKARLGIYELGCKFGDAVITEKVLPNGETYEVETYTCTTCGLVLSGGFYSVIDEDTCQRFSNEEYTLVMGDTQIIACQFSQGVEMHPGVVEQFVVDLTAEEYGLCGVKLVVKTCPCGKQTLTTEQESCNWNYDGYYEEDGIGTWRHYCVNCGAIKVNQDWTTPIEGTCDSIYYDVYTYYVKDIEVYSYTNTSHRDNHAFELTSYELQGESCEDGVLTVSTCAVCGEVNEEYKTYHECLVATEIDLTAGDICMDAIIQMSCPCGAYKEIEEVGSTHCQWGPWEGHDGSQCMVCGATIVSKSESTKNEYCEWMFYSEHTYSDKNGNVLAVVYNTRSEIRHNFKTTYHLLGTSCTDGVEVTRECSDCAMLDKWTNYDHFTDQLAEYYLPDYGMCEGYYRIYGCPCGEQYWYEEQFSCNYDSAYGDQYWEEIRCSQCGVTRINYWEPLEQVDPCHVIRKEGYAFYKDGELLLDGTYRSNGTNHDYLFTTSLMNEAGDCYDGVYVTATCSRCGDISTWETYDHEPFARNVAVYGEGVLCSPVELREYSCGCGLESGTDIYYMGGNSCGFGPESWSDEYNGYVSTCYSCGAKRVGVETSVPVEGQSCRYQVENNYTYFTADGEELFSYSHSYISTRHTWNTSFQLMGATCADGYYISRVCADCGQRVTDPELLYGCSWFDIETELIYQGENACGPVYIVMDGCACGAKRSFYLRSDCHFESYGYDDKYQMHLEQCRTCGLMYGINSTREQIPGSCDCIETTHYRFFWDGQEIASVQKTYVTKAHTWLNSFELYGNSCDDGYALIRTCQYCGARETQPERYGHEAFLVASYNLADYGICSDGQSQIRCYSCACGEESFVNSDIYCYWNSTGKVDPDTGAQEYFCEGCNCYFYYIDRTVVDTATCKYSGMYKARWVRDGETVLSVEYELCGVSHTYLMTDVSFNTPDGNCEGGFTATLTCKHCGDTTFQQEGGYHPTYRKQIIDLTEMGACGGDLVLWECPCGERSEFNHNWHCQMSYQEESTGDHRNGTTKQIRTCTDCGLTIVEDLVRTTPEGSCYGQNDWTVTATRGDRCEVVRYTSSHEAHEYYRTGVEFDVPDGDCEDGYTAYMTCSVCADTYSYHSNHHNSEITERVNLTQFGACAGEFYLRSCACGEYSSFEYDLNCTMETTHESNGNGLKGYELYTRTCTQCGLKVEERRTWSRPADTCQGTDYFQITFTVGDVSRYIEFTGKNVSHDYEYTYELKPGSVSCEDGLYAYAACIYCGDGYTTNSYSHECMRVESIDLVKYGSVCGGTLDHYTCLCGAEQYYEFSEDIACDLDRQWTQMWIENDLDDGQDTSEGWQSCYTNSYIYTCAVTDPACGMQIRMASYWIKEGCTAKQYETWQLGYDPATGECMYEFTIATGEECGFHDYFTSNIYETLEDGTVVSGTLFACEDCGSYRSFKNFYRNGVEIKREDLRVNTLDNGENRQWCTLDEYDYDLGLLYDYNFPTLSRHETVYADGSSYWYQSAWTYDHTDGCKETVVYTNSDGYSSTSVNENHRTTWSRIRTVDPTCTQHGMEEEKYVCVVCGLVESIEYYPVEPNAHDWHWDYAREIYYCSTCGLENVYGASGAIVLEDMTESRGNGTDFVIGYWDREGVNFGLYVSLIPAGADGDSEIVLEGVDFTYLTAENDGVRAISFSKEQVKSAAEASGYTDGYDIRINFVPMTGSHTLDYAITLTNMTAQ